MRKDLFDELAGSVREMKDVRDGTRKPARMAWWGELLRDGCPDVAELRARFALSQAKFAALPGISVDTLQNREQGRRHPEGPARVLLRVAATHPDAFLSIARDDRRRARQGA